MVPSINRANQTPGVQTDPHPRDQELIYEERGGRVLDSRWRGCGFQPHGRHCIVFLSKTFYDLLSADSTQDDLSRHDWKVKNQTNKSQKTSTVPSKWQIIKWFRYPCYDNACRLSLLNLLPFPSKAIWLFYKSHTISLSSALTCLHYL